MDPRMESKVRQGITTEVNGNCGISPAPVNEKTQKFEELSHIPKEEVDWTTMDGYFKRLEKQGASLNVIMLVGHGTVRCYVMGDEVRAPTSPEMEEMKMLVRAAMEDGAAGLSTGLEYFPGVHAHTDEIVELAKVAAEYGGIYASHLRSSGSKVLGWPGEGGTILEAVAEAIDIGRRTGLRVQLSHLSAQCAFTRDQDMSNKVYHLIVSAREEGIDVVADKLTDVWGSVAPWPRRTVFPSAYLADGNEKLFEMLRDSDTRAKIKEELKTKSPSEMGFVEMTDRLLLIRQGKGDSVWIFPPFNGHMKNPDYEYKTLDEIARMMGKNLWDTLFDLILEEEGNICISNKQMAIGFPKEEFSWSMMMPSTDGGSIEKPGSLAKDRVRPSAYGAFPTVLAWAREKNTLTLEEVVRKATSLPARTIGLKDRGLIKEGFCADITVFDPDTVKSRCTFENDARPEYPEGIPYVLVNGQIVVDDNEHTGTLPGKVLRHPL
jgi:N-acyl-D-aspartate/D-glutamate deacylase